MIESRTNLPAIFNIGGGQGIQKSGRLPITAEVKGRDGLMPSSPANTFNHPEGHHEKRTHLLQYLVYHYA